MEIEGSPIGVPLNAHLTEAQAARDDDRITVAAIAPAGLLAAVPGFPPCGRGPAHHALALIVS